MSKLFLIFYLASCFGSLLVDRKELQRVKKPARYVYFAVFGAVLTLFSLRMLGVEVVLPTKLIVHTVASWAYDLMKSDK